MMKKNTYLKQASLENSMTLNIEKINSSSLCQDLKHEIYSGARMKSTKILSLSTGSQMKSGS